MTVALTILEEMQRYSRQTTRRNFIMPTKNLSVAQIERQLGIDKSKIKPISATSSDNKEFEEKGDIFREWYEEELRALYDEEY